MPDKYEFTDLGLIWLERKTTRGDGKVWTRGVDSSIVKTREGISDVIVYSGDMYDSERYVEFNEK